MATITITTKATIKPSKEDKARGVPEVEVADG
jgi:hypothetical protein